MTAPPCSALWTSMILSSKEMNVLHSVGQCQHWSVSYSISKMENLSFLIQTLFFFSSSWYDRPLLVWQSRGKKSKSFPTQEVRVGLPLVDSSYLTTFHSCTFGSTTKKGVKRTPKTVNLSIYLEERAESLKENSSTPSCPVLTTLLYPLKETISLGCQWL